MENVDPGLNEGFLSNTETLDEINMEIIETKFDDEPDFENPNMIFAEDVDDISIPKLKIVLLYSDSK